MDMIFAISGNHGENIEFSVVFVRNLNLVVYRFPLNSSCNIVFVGFGDHQFVNSIY